MVDQDDNGRPLHACADSAAAAVGTTMRNEVAPLAKEDWCMYAEEQAHRKSNKWIGIIVMTIKVLHRLRHMAIRRGNAERRRQLWPAWWAFPRRRRLALAGLLTAEALKGNKLHGAAQIGSNSQSHEQANRQQAPKASAGGRAASVRVSNSAPWRYYMYE